jgi:transcriptional regulator with XRE-family HTH domain
MPLSTRLQQLRQQAGLTQQELASKAGVTLSVLARIEAGRIKAPRWDTICALADALGCKLDDLRDPPASAPTADGQGE